MGRKHIGQSRIFTNEIVNHGPTPNPAMRDFLLPQKSQGRGEKINACAVN
jgi:hypothetical protein